MSAQDRPDAPRAGSAIREKAKDSCRSIVSGVRKMRLRMELDRWYRDLGYAVSEEHFQRPFLPQAFAAELARIEALKHEVDSPAQVGGSPVCGGCGRLAPSDAQFCPTCGRKVT